MSGEIHQRDQALTGELPPARYDSSMSRRSFPRFYGRNASKTNGAEGGRPLGRKNDKTLLLEAEHEAFQQFVLQNTTAIRCKLALAKASRLSIA